MSDDTPSLSQTGIRSASRTYRRDLIPGIGAIILCSVIGITGNFYWANTQGITGLLLALSFLVAAVISPRIWVSVRILAMGITFALLAVYWLASNTTVLPFGFTSTDLVVASLGAWLVQLLARNQAFNRTDAVTSIESIVANTPIRSASEFDQALGLELVRSRRHERTFCVVTLKLDQPLTDLVDHNLPRLNQILGGTLRWIDHMYLSPDPSELFLICPETNKAGIQVLADRLWGQFESTFHVEIAIRWAVFPDECLTSTDLIAKARGKALDAGTRGTRKSVGIFKKTDMPNPMDSANNQYSS